jgi:L-alanine-DL-glutamate epimerase-like enolase superfamily enzyme
VTRIVDISTFLLTAPGRHLGMPDTQRSAALIQITTDDGLTGLGETYAGLYVPTLVPPCVDLYRPLLLEQEPHDIGRLMRAMRLRSMRWGMLGLPVQVMSGIEMALWDLKAKQLNRPAYEVLGGLAQGGLRLYASAYAAIFPPEETGKKVLHYAEKGFTAVKLATGFWNRPRAQAASVTEVIDEECSKLEAIRGAVGPGIDLALDHHGANNPRAWSEATAIDVIRALDEYRLMWFEQPCASHDIEGYARLCATVTTPIAGGEDATTVAEIARFLEQQALDVVQPDAAWMGVGATQQVFDLARARGIRATLHVAGTAVARAANYHLAFTRSECSIVEYQVEHNPLFDELLVEPFEIESGHLHPPTAPGFGVRLTRETLERFPFVARPWTPSHQPGGAAQGTAR